MSNTSNVKISAEVVDKLHTFDWAICVVKETLPAFFPDKKTIIVEDASMDYLYLNVDGTHYMMDATGELK